MIRLNLLSEKEKEQIKKDMLAAEVANSVLAIFVVVVLIAIVFFFGQKYLNYRIENMAKYAPTTDENAVDEINKKMGQIIELQKDYLKWSVLLKDVIALVPENIKINSLELSKENKKIMLYGLAESRTDYLKLEDNLRNSALVADIKSPVSNLLRRNNIDFSIEATMK